MSDTKPAQAEYEVLQAREILGVWRKAGERVPLLPSQAKYYLPPYGLGVTLAVAKSATGAEKRPIKGDKVAD